MGEDDTKMHLTAKLAFSNNTGEVSARKAAVSSQINVLSKHVKVAGGYPYWEGDIAPCDFYGDSTVSYDVRQTTTWPNYRLWSHFPPEYQVMEAGNSVSIRFTVASPK